MKIGLIGLGIMGKPMAKNMLKAGYDLTVSDLNKANVDEVVAAGAKAITTSDIMPRVVSGLFMCGDDETVSISFISPSASLIQPLQASYFA